MKQLIGKVSSLPGTQTARVSVSRQWSHPLYKKSVKRTKNYACHLENLEVEVGDTVAILPCRPISKTKHFRVVAKVEMEQSK
ncbi:30S ribosomal protein S17 [Candidatus Woesebacteria bacterium]|nr:30S ribosomal protein S17 [Candidatus Woesebacteria bacterium]